MVDQGPAETVRHEEVARTRTERVATRRARLHRVVVRERRTIEVEVAHEEFRLVVDDLEPGDAVLPAAGVRSVSTVLHEERIEVVRRVVPVERVTAVVDVVEGAEDAVVALRHERVAIDGVEDAAPGRPA